MFFKKLVIFYVLLVLLTAYAENNESNIANDMLQKMSDFNMIVLEKTDEDLAKLLKTVENGSPLIVFVKNKTKEERKKLSQDINAIVEKLTRMLNF